MSKRHSQKYKIDRRMGENIWGRVEISHQFRRPYGPGEHGQRRKGKMSDFGLQLMAKQKLKGYYGNITEKQFKRTYGEAQRRRGNTAENLIGAAGKPSGRDRLPREVRSDGFRCAPVRQSRPRQGQWPQGHRPVFPAASRAMWSKSAISRASHGAGARSAGQRRSATCPDYIDIDPKAMKATYTRVPEFSDVPYPVKHGAEPRGRILLLVSPRGSRESRMARRHVRRAFFLPACAVALRLTPLESSGSQWAAARRGDVMIRSLAIAALGAAALGLSGCAAGPVADPRTGYAPERLEQVLAWREDAAGDLVIRVQSNGCTTKDSFDVLVTGSAAQGWAFDMALTPGPRRPMPGLPAPGRRPDLDQGRAGPAAERSGERGQSSRRQPSAAAAPSAPGLTRRSAAQAGARPLALEAAASSPASNISVMMSQPPTNSPLT